MSSLLNTGRPPVFCPGCSHERITHGLDKAFQNMGLSGEQIVIVTDIGCSGLFDTFFHTHAFHGLHGRALTYATGLKMARPELTVIVTMGDGGLGIGGAHILSACRRNLDITLLILNNFNFGMTGGQFSATTPSQVQVGSGFLNRLERPMDVCRVMSSAGAAYAVRCSSYAKDLAQEIENAVRFEGFSIIDIWGICPGRYSQRNKMTPQIIEDSLAKLPSRTNPIPENIRKEYGRHYRELAAEQTPVSSPAKIETKFHAPDFGRKEVVILGSAGQRIITAGEILCLAGLTAGLNVTQKNEYDITVLRGACISDVILSPEEIGYTGITSPDIVLALSQEGVDRRKHLFDHLDKNALIIRAEKIHLPPCNAEVQQPDFKAHKIKSSDRALAALSFLSKLKMVIYPDMLESALAHRFKDNILASALDLVRRVEDLGA
ncbi:MAG: thiamine pyrophosphate-dependent enzyme [Desulfobacterales bacterium]|jgi:pyruvate/2-oxoacid:ferredoxin oxidoreductase beta subunit